MTLILLLWLILCGCLTGLWAFDCEPGKFKQNDVCKTCPMSCSNCISDDKCTECKLGFYGNICGEHCSDSCSDRKCRIENGQCVSCAIGHYFSGNETCVKCPDHCTYCQSRDKCNDCEIGFTGTTCNEECTNCNPVSGCNIETKVCFAGCKEGYSDPTCVKRCASKCKSCEPYDANKCKSCAFNRYGSNCENTCPTMCRDFKCNNGDGNCTQGCKEGFWGYKCEKTCSINCREGVCHQINGSCSNGCQGDFTGNMCNCPSGCECESDETCEKCSTNSSFDCNRNCSEFCVRGICSFDTQQKCLYGCPEGYRDILCDSQNYPEGESSTSNVIIVVIAIIAGIILVAIVVIFICRKRLHRLISKRSDDYRSAEADAPERIELIDRRPATMQQTDTNLEMDNTRQDAANRNVLGTEQHTSIFPSENRARSITSVSQYDVRMRDEVDCWISGCCMLPNDEIFLMDKFNKNLKKLDTSYRVTSTCKLCNVIDVLDLTNPTTLTYIGNSDVVVCAEDIRVYVNVSGIMTIKTTEPDTYDDVTCRNDMLYLLYDTSIHINTLEGDAISVLPLEESAGGSNRRIAVADDGRMYVTDDLKGLICLDSSGYVINTLPDVKLSVLCVDDRGNVWAGGSVEDKNVYQISADGSQILNTLPVKTLGGILSLCYDKHRSSLIICGISNKITVIGLN